MKGATVTDAEKLLAELVEHFHVNEKPDWLKHGAYDTLQLAHGSGEYRYWFSVSGNSMDEAALGHLGDILRRSRLALGLNPGPELYPQALAVTMTTKPK
jgi:hypothetical protein